MPRDLFLDLLITVASKPHRNCLHQSRVIRKQIVRHTSTSPSNPSKSRSKPPTPTAAATSTRASGPKNPISPNVPIHVGLDRNPENVSAISRIPIPQGVKGENFKPSVLSRPLGLTYPPRPGQNSPIDRRSSSEKREEDNTMEKVRERRQVYFRTFLRPYYQDRKGLSYYKGKSFISNENLVRKDKALYFPNVWGSTLVEDGGDGPDGGRDITPTLTGKVSVVTFFSNQWSEEQVDSFVGPKANPELEDIIRSTKGGTTTGKAQRVDVNIQGDWARLMLVKLFKGRLRQTIPKERWDKYFMLKLPRDVRKGFTEDIRDAIGLLNSEVGYVYLVDQQCKIRWAASGDAWQGEVASLNAGMKRLIQEAS